MGQKGRERWKSKRSKHLIVGPLLEVEMSTCTPSWHEAHFEVTFGPRLEVEMSKSARRCGHVQSAAYSEVDVEKVYAVVAQNTCGGENANGIS